MSEQMTGPDPTLKFLALKKCFYHVFGVNENSKKKNYEKGIIIQLFSVDAIAFSKKSRKKYYKGMMTKLLCISLQPKFISQSQSQIPYFHV